MAEPDEIPFIRTAPQAGVLEQISPLVRRLVAPNPGPMTFSGTCTYVVGRGRVAVIDPGPDLPGHVEALLQALPGETIEWIVGTHTHIDHTPAAEALRAATGAKRVGCGPYVPPPNGPASTSHDRMWMPDVQLADGEIFEGAGFRLEAIATPGHAANHLAFALPEENTLFSGDHVMGWSTSVVAPPDGHMGDYMASLDKLRARADALYWPGHGAAVTEPQRYVRALSHHRRQREAAILTRLREGDRTIAQLVARMYQGLDPRLIGGAARSVLAHLEDLMERGVVAREGAVPLEADYRVK